MKHCQVVIVGQGIAGTSLAWALEKSGISFAIYADDLINTSSLLAAGLINPVTGRKYVKSWMVEDLWPMIEPTYRSMGESIGQNVISHVEYLRDFHSPGDENAWLSRCNDALYQRYIYSKQPFEIPHVRFNSSSLFGVTRGYRIHADRLLTGMRQRWILEGKLINEIWETDRMVIKDKIYYDGLSCDHVVYCSGVTKTGWSYFDDLPLIPNAGEFLIVEIPGLETDYLLKRSKVLVPLGDHRYWFGATYDWDCRSTCPTTEGKKQLVKALRDMLDGPFEIVHHFVGIRPTVKDRRPLMGTHYKYPNVHLFNGFGTKGYSLTPYWADHFIKYLTQNKPLDDSVNINRFSME